MRQGEQCGQCGHTLEVDPFLIRMRAGSGGSEHCRFGAGLREQRGIGPERDGGRPAAAVGQSRETAVSLEIVSFLSSC